MKLEQDLPRNHPLVSLRHDIHLRHFECDSEGLEAARRVAAVAGRRRLIDT